MFIKYLSLMLGALWVSCTASSPTTPKTEIGEALSHTTDFELEADAYSLSTERGEETIFVVDRRFGHAGDWGVEVQFAFPSTILELFFIVWKVF